jgi:hypothetical protein
MLWHQATCVKGKSNGANPVELANWLGIISAPSTGKSPIPVERTLLTTTILDFWMRSLAAGGKRWRVRMNRSAVSQLPDLAVRECGLEQLGRPGAVGSEDQPS